MIQKKIVMIAAAVAIAVSACNSDSGKDGDKTTNGEKQETKSGPSASPDYAPGLEVVGKSDCNTCHRLDEKLQGPSLKDIAKRYADSSKAEIVPRLAQKIIDGGVGNWGEIPMTPHPSLTPEEAEAAVKYVLLFKD